MLFIESVEQQLLHALDLDLDQASDDWLFATGYLRGHITLAVADWLSANTDTDLAALQQIEQLNQQIENSLAQAISAGELTPVDQQLVAQVWQSLYQQTLQHFALN